MQKTGWDFYSVGHILLQAQGLCCLSAGQDHNQQERLSCRVLQKSTVLPLRDGKYRSHLNQGLVDPQLEKRALVHSFSSVMHKYKHFSVRKVFEKFSIQVNMHKYYEYLCRIACFLEQY